jgi:hypothetical protein
MLLAKAHLSIGESPELSDSRCNIAARSQTIPDFTEHPTGTGVWRTCPELV